MTDDLLSSSSSAAERLARQAARHGLALLDAAAFETFAGGEGDRVVLLAEDPVRVPETWDLLVVLSELLKLRPGCYRAGLLEAGAARALAPRHAIARLPALLFLREGAFVGAIEGVHDWEALAREFMAMLARPVRGTPLPRQAEAAACR